MLWNEVPRRISIWF